MGFKVPTLKASNGGGDFLTRPVLEAGMYSARLMHIIDLGLQPGSNEHPTDKHKMEFVFELQDEMMLDKEGNEVEGKPATFSMDVAYQPDGYMHEKSGMYAMYLALNPEITKGPEELLGTPCVLVMKINHYKSGKKKGEPYSAIASVAPMKEKDKAKCTPLVNEPQYFDLDFPDMDLWASLTKGNQYAQQDKIKAGLAFASTALAKALGLDVVPETPADGPAPDPDAFEGEPDADGQPAEEPAVNAAEAPADEEDEDPFA